MEALMGGLVAIVIGQFSLLWWRIGRLEGKVDRINGGNLGKGKKPE